MAVRGRKSAEEEKTKAIQVHERPRPPADLNPVAANEWNRVVNSVSADWFEPHHFTTLAACCSHVADLAEINARLAEAKGNPDFAVADYDRLLKMRERETRAVNAHMRSMRLTHQATYSSRKTLGDGKGGEELWQ